MVKTTKKLREELNLHHKNVAYVYYLYKYNRKIKPAIISWLFYYSGASISKIASWAVTGFDFK